MAHMVTLPLWGGARPIRLPSSWLWLGEWRTVHRDRMDGMSDPRNHAPLFVALARARFGLGMAASGLSGASQRALEGRALPPRRGGTRLYIMNGVTRDATQERGGWKSPAVMEAGHSRTRYEEVLPEMQAPVAKACAVFGVTALVEDADGALRPDSLEVFGPDNGAQVRA